MGARPSTIQPRANYMSVIRPCKASARLPKMHRPCCHAPRMRHTSSRGGKLGARTKPCRPHAQTARLVKPTRPGPTLPLRTRVGSVVQGSMQSASNCIQHRGIPIVIYKVYNMWQENCIYGPAPTSKSRIRAAGIRRDSGKSALRAMRARDGYASRGSSSGGYHA